jgi:hypothetical protein
VIYIAWPHESRLVEEKGGLVDHCYESYWIGPNIMQEMTEIIRSLQGDIPPTSTKRFPYVSGMTKAEDCANHFVKDGATPKGINEINVIVWHALLSTHKYPYSNIREAFTVMILNYCWNGIKIYANGDLWLTQEYLEV